MAKIRVYDVIREIDQVPIADVKNFESLVAATKKEGGETVRLLIFDKGKLRFANLGVSPVAP
jgi:C-terminal processing protease CtpA/Prc